MKKIITLLSAALLITACCNDNTTKEKPFIDDKYVDAFCTFRKVKIENHTYIMLTDGQRMGFTHDPECPYCKEQNFPEHKLETTDF